MPGRSRRPASAPSDPPAPGKCAITATDPGHRRHGRAGDSWTGRWSPGRALVAVTLLTSLVTVSAFGDPRSLAAAVCLSAGLLVFLRAWRRTRGWAAVGAMCCATALFYVTNYVSAATVLGIVAWIALVQFGFLPTVALFSILLGATTMFYVAVGDSASFIVSNSVAMALMLLLCFLLAALVRSAELEAARSRALVARAEAGIRAQLEQAVEAERSSSARILHDGLGQQLIVVLLSLDCASAMAAAGRWPDGRAEIAHARAAAANALQDLRRWVRALSPPPVPAPETIGETRSSLTTLARLFGGAGFTVRVHAPPPGADDVRIGPDVGRLLHMAAREGLANALRHAAEPEIDIRLSLTPDTGSVELVVDDHGRCDRTRDRGGRGGGTAPTAGDHRDDDLFASGFGLRSLRERAGLLGGSCTAGTGDDGFTLAVRAPVPHGAGA